MSGISIETSGVSCSERRASQRDPKATAVPSTVGTDRATQHIDVLVVLEDVSADAARVFRRSRGSEAERFGGGVETNDVLDVDPEVVVGRQDRQSEEDQGAATDQE